MAAVKNVRPQVVHEFLERGARVSDINSLGNTALKYALSIPLVPVGWRNRETAKDVAVIVDDLMAHGADVPSCPLCNDRFSTCGLFRP